MTVKSDRNADTAFIGSYKCFPHIGTNPSDN